jgi:putative ABC transport system ATP-binding protein
VIELRHVTKVFGTGEVAVRAIDDLTFLLPRGGFWSLVGPSGSGKSTVLHLVAGITPPTSGTVLVDGVDVGAATDEAAATLRRRRIGYVFQSFSLMPFLTAERNVATPLLLDGVPRGEIGARVADALALVRMGHRAAHRPSELSGGEQQRIAVARALVTRPPILLADEPTGNLDRTSGEEVMDLIQDVHERLEVTVLLVTHNPTFAACAERVLRLVDGSLEQVMDFPAPSAAAPPPKVQ